ncbi:MAG: DegV family protein [Anaerolineales bacterium]
MSKVCILTDSTVQFTHPNFPGHERVYVIPFEIQLTPPDGEISMQNNGLSKRLVPPSLTEFTRYYSQLSREYDTIFVLTLSSLLNPTMQVAQCVSTQSGIPATIVVIDSQTTGVGLGLLVQAAAAAAAAGATPADIERQMRASIPRIYMLFCIPELTYLAHSGFMDYSQALVAEMMGMLPIFVIEDGRLTPMEKVRTQRHLFESFLEFINEFEKPAHIALMRAATHNSSRSRAVRQYIQENFPGTCFSEHTIAPHLAALFGPQSTALVIMEKVD